MNIEKHEKAINHTLSKIEHYRRLYYLQDFRNSQALYIKSDDLILADRLKELAKEGNQFALQFYSSDGKSRNSRHFMIELYPCDNLKHSRALERIIYDMNLCVSFIIHHKEFDADMSYCPFNIDPCDYYTKCTKPHIHLVVSFPSAKTFTAVANLLKVDCKFCLPCASLKDALLYLTHDGYDKIQYDKHDCVLTSHHNNVLTEIIEDKRDVDIFDRIEIVVNYLDKCSDVVSLCDVSFRKYLKLHNLGCMLTNAPMQRVLNDLLREHNKPFTIQLENAKKENKELRRLINGQLTNY